MKERIKQLLDEGHGLRHIARMLQIDFGQIRAIARGEDLDSDEVESPTPEEIAERVAIVKAKRLEAMRNMVYAKRDDSLREPRFYAEMPRLRRRKYE
jgi:hypothetical protein